MAALADATLFSIPSDGGEPERLARARLTDIMQTDSGNEVRAAVRSVPVRRYEFTAKFGSAAEAMEFRALWLTAPERLRFIVPIWMRGTIPSALPDTSTITTDTRHRGFVAGGRALLAQFDDRNNVAVSELVEIDTVSDDGVTLVDPYVNDYVVGPTSLLPVMNAWLDPPVVEQFGVDTERVPLVFREELPGISGIDPDVGDSETPEPATLRLDIVASGSPWPGRKYVTIGATVKDASGAVIPNADITWEVETPYDGMLDPPTKITYPPGGQSVGITFEGGTATYFTVTATAGASSDVLGV